MVAYGDPGTLIAVSAVLVVLAISAVTLRFFVRWKQQTRPKWDDYLILIALVFGVGLAVLEIYACAKRLYGTALGSAWGSSLQDPRVRSETAVEESFLLLGIVCLGFVKVSVICFYRRMFGTSKIFRYVTIVWMVVCIVWALTFTIAILLQTGSTFWARFCISDATTDRCSTSLEIGLAMVISDVVTEAGTLVMPIPMIVGLNMPMRRKLALVAMFSLGGLALGASIGKCIVYYQVGIYFAAGKGDLFLLATGISIWNLAGALLSILAACLPTLRPILVMVLASKSVQKVIGFIPWAKHRNTSTVTSSTYPAQPHEIIVDEERQRIQPGGVNQLSNFDQLTKESEGDLDLSEMLAAHQPRNTTVSR